MLRRLIKSYLPRSLLWRVICILVVPIVVIQIIVGYVFTDRIYRDITVQLTEGLSLDLKHVLEQVNRSEDQELAIENARRTANALAIALVKAPSPASEFENPWFYDISGRQLIATLKSKDPSVLEVDLITDFRALTVRAETRHGLVDMKVNRRRASASNPHQVLVVMVLASILMTSIGFLFMKNQIRPIKRLSEASEEFGKGRNIAFRPQGATEVWSAGHAFLAMRKRIENHLEQRTMMLSGVSHDLRTPLTRMRLSLSLLEKSDEVDLLEKDVEEMEEMLDSFLTFAKGTPSGLMDEIIVKNFVKEILRDHKRTGRHIDLEFIGQPPGETKVSCNSGNLRRAINNLVNNAFKHAKIVSMIVKIGPKSIEFRIDDNGQGIPKDRREAAMRPFSKLDSARNQNSGGSAGLGLAIASDVARNHGGSLSLAQSPKLGGLRAVIRIPR